MADGLREVHEPILEGPLRRVGGKHPAEGEVGRAAGLNSRHELARMLVLWMEDELGMFAALVLERGDDLSDRCVFLPVVSLIPPHHEIARACAERRHDQRGKGEYL